MVMKGLPESFKPFIVHVTQSETTMTFADFKVKLKSYEDTEKIRVAAVAGGDNVMKARIQTKTKIAPPDLGSWRTVDAVVICYKCGQKGHKAKTCYRKRWCYYCISNTHQTAACRRKPQKDMARGAADEDNGKEFVFRLRDEDQEIQMNSQVAGLMVATGATSHIITNLDNFRRFDEDFKPKTHHIELANGTRCKGVAEKRGEAVVTLTDSRGRQHRAVLKHALDIPSYPQDIFSVKTATSNGATVFFKQGEDVLKCADGTRFPIIEHNRLYFLQTVSNDQCNASYDIQTWHEIMGHCNYDDLRRLQNVVDGMNIKEMNDKQKCQCETCIKGKFIQMRNR
ncbi:uncharacterized protein [Nothobranchius furzeri]|uniref:uncharacterized protein isoform X2 n=1 Tax=Nothobranchius furzeri TaxID=105023 RepID=UPI003904CC89